jgi:acyl carrier protein
MNAARTHVQQISAQIRCLLRQARADQAPIPAAGDDVPLRGAGLSSLEMVAFLVLIEDHFGITLDENLPADTLRSLNSIAHYLADIGA